MAVRIPLTRGMYALVSNKDAEAVGRYRWYVRVDQHTCYAQRDVRTPAGRRTTQKMHTFLTGYHRTDHRNGNGLDNRRANLREATSGQNTRNRRKIKGCTSRFKGVYWHRPTERWQARLRPGSRQISLGYFGSEEDAALAYDTAARAAFGEFAALNFPEPGERSALI